MSSKFGDMAVGMGLAESAAAQMSMNLTQLTADLASFKNADTAQVAQALTGIFTGEGEALKGLGVVMTQVNLQNFAYGITDISLATYTIYTFLFMLPGVALFTIGSAGFTAQSGKWMYFAAAGVLLVLVFGMGWFVKKKYLEAPASRKEDLSYEKADME
jgi:hypothetical protein